MRAGGADPVLRMTYQCTTREVSAHDTWVSRTVPISPCEQLAVRRQLDPTPATREPPKSPNPPPTSPGGQLCSPGTCPFDEEMPRARLQLCCRAR